MNLMPEERQILELKYASKPFFFMSPKEISISANELLIKIHVITGWNFPADKMLQDVLRDQFQKKLIESYSKTNVSEIEYAFRNNSAVKDYGKNMNLNIIDEVMISYLKSRHEVSELQLRTYEELPPAKDAKPLSDEELIEMAAGTWKAVKNYQLLPLRAYDVLKDKMQLTDEQKEATRAFVEAELNRMSLEDKNLFETTPRQVLHTRLCKKWSVACYLENLQKEEGK